MPRYSYKCDDCDEIFETFHLMNETLTECVECGSTAGNLYKVPSSFSIVEEGKQVKATAQQRVDEFIKEARSELKEHQQESQKEYIPK